jgi:hypothetical protein
VADYIVFEGVVVIHLCRGPAGVRTYEYRVYAVVGASDVAGTLSFARFACRADRIIVNPVVCDPAGKRAGHVDHRARVNRGAEGVVVDLVVVRPILDSYSERIGGYVICDSADPNVGFVIQFHVRIIVPGERRILTRVSDELNAV